MNRHKILFCIDALVRGGTELQLIGLINKLDRHRYEPLILTLRPMDPALVPKDCRHIAWHVPKLISLAGLSAMLKLAKLLKKERIDIVQTFFQDSTIFAGLAARIAGTPVRIACFRDLGFWNTRAQAALMRLAYSTMNGFISNAQVIVDHFSQQFGIDPQKVTIIHNGVDNTALPFVEHSGPVRNVGIVGNMTRAVKRTDLFIQAAALVAEHHPEIRWHIIGDGNLRTELEQLANTLKVTEQIVFAGRIANIGDYLEKMQVGVICSDSEGLSNALIEYMYKGVASVATAAGGNTELVTHGVTGLLVPTDNAEALAHAILQLIENNELRQNIAQAARRQVEQNFSWEKCLAEHNAFYTDKLISHPRANHS